MFPTLAFALALLAPVHAFWILTHDHALTYERLDPIVNPGVVSPHVHSIIGSDAFAPTMSYPQMQGASSCTTSPVQDDRSSYWAQSLYHRAANGTFTLIPISFVQTYYLQRAGPTQTNISAFPPGLRMVAGDPYRSTYNASNIPDQAISFVCLNGADPTNNNGPQTAFPQTACPDGLRMQVNFPSCWDGANLDTPDHMAHMAYPEGHPDSGDCPASHPVKTILLFNEYVYDVGAFDFVPGADSWVTATGDATGYSFHADFINGWKESTLAAAVAQCTGSLFGNLEGCPPFLASLNRTTAHTCALAPVVEEAVLGPLAAIPGCNPYTGQPVTGMAQCPDMPVPAIKGGGGAPTPANGTAPSNGPGNKSCTRPRLRAAVGGKRRSYVHRLWNRRSH